MSTSSSGGGGRAASASCSARGNLASISAMGRKRRRTTTTATASTVDTVRSTGAYQNNNIFSRQCCSEDDSQQKFHDKPIDAILQQFTVSHLVRSWFMGAGSNSSNSSTGSRTTGISTASCFGRRTTTTKRRTCTLRLSSVPCVSRTGSSTGSRGAVRRFDRDNREEIIQRRRARNRNTRIMPYDDDDDSSTNHQNEATSGDYDVSTIFFLTEGEAAVWPRRSENHDHHDNRRCSYIMTTRQILLRRKGEGGLWSWSWLFANSSSRSTVNSSSVQNVSSLWRHITGTLFFILLISNGIKVTRCQEQGDTTVVSPSVLRGGTRASSSSSSRSPVRRRYLNNKHREDMRLVDAPPPNVSDSRVEELLLVEDRLNSTTIVLGTNDTTNIGEAPTFAPTTLTDLESKYTLAQVLETTFVGGQVGYGCMFDISSISSEPVLMTGLDVVVKNSISKQVLVKDNIIQLYTIVGSHIGYEQYQEEWSRLDVTVTDTSTTPVLAASGNQLVHIELNSPLLLDAGGTRGWYVTFSSAEDGDDLKKASMVFTKAPPDKPTGSLFRFDDQIQVTVGVGVAYSFGKLDENIGFNGVVRYSIASPTESSNEGEGNDSAADGVLKTKQSIFVVGVGNKKSERRNVRRRQQRQLLKQPSPPGLKSITKEEESFTNINSNRLADGDKVEAEAFKDGAVVDYFEFVVGEFLSKHFDTGVVSSNKNNSTNTTTSTANIEIKRVSVQKAYIELVGNGDDSDLLTGYVPTFNDISRVALSADIALASSDTPVLYVETIIEATNSHLDTTSNAAEEDVFTKEEFATMVQNLFVQYGTQFVQELKTTYFYGELFQDALWSSSKILNWEDDDIEKIPEDSDEDDINVTTEKEDDEDDDDNQINGSDNPSQGTEGGGSNTNPIRISVISGIAAVAAVAVIAIGFLVWRMRYLISPSKNHDSSNNIDDTILDAHVEPATRHSSDLSPTVTAAADSSKSDLLEKKKLARQSDDDHKKKSLSKKSSKKGTADGPSRANVVGAGQTDVNLRRINRMLNAQQAGRDDMQDLSPLFGSASSLTGGGGTSSPGARRSGGGGGSSSAAATAALKQTNEEQTRLIDPKTQEDVELLLGSSGGSMGDYHQLEGQRHRQPFGRTMSPLMVSGGLSGEQDPHEGWGMNDDDLREYLLKMEKREEDAAAATAAAAARRRESNKSGGGGGLPNSNEGGGGGTRRSSSKARMMDHRTSSKKLSSSGASGSRRSSSKKLKGMRSQSRDRVQHQGSSRRSLSQSRLEAIGTDKATGGDGKGKSNGNPSSSISTVEEGSSSPNDAAGVVGIRRTARSTSASRLSDLKSGRGATTRASGIKKASSYYDTNGMMNAEFNETFRIDSDDSGDSSLAQQKEGTASAGGATTTTDPRKVDTTTDPFARPSTIPSPRTKGRRVVRDLKQVLPKAGDSVPSEVTPSSEECGGEGGGNSSIASDQSPEGDHSVMSAQSVVSATPDDFIPLEDNEDQSPSNNQDGERLTQRKVSNAAAASGGVASGTVGAGDHESKATSRTSGSASGVSSETSSLPSRYKEMWASVSDPDALNLLKNRLSDHSIELDSSHLEAIESARDQNVIRRRNNIKNGVRSNIGNKVTAATGTNNDDNDDNSSLSSSSQWSAERIEEEEALRQKMKSVQFHPTVVTDVMYRPKTSAEDVERLYYQGHKKLKRKPRATANTTTITTSAAAPPPQQLAPPPPQPPSSSSKQQPP